MLKPRDERDADRLADHRPAAAEARQGRGRQPVPAGRRRTSPSAAASRARSFQYTLQDSDIDELNEWSQKMLDKMRTLPQIADVASDLLANAPQLKITINRDQAARFGISPQLIDDTLNDAFGQRQITQYFTQLKTYFVILEILPELQKRPVDARPALCEIAADRRRRAAVVAGRCRHQQGRPALGVAPGPVPGGHAVVQPAARRRARRGGRRDRARPRARSTCRRRSSRTFQGNAQAFQNSLSSEPILIAAALIVVYIILGHALRELHPSADHSVDAAVGRRRRAAGAAGRQHGPVGDRHHRHHPADRHRQEERHHAGRLRASAPSATAIMRADEAIREACLLRFRPILMTTAAAMLAGVPLALGHGTGSELRQPLGYAMVGGLALSQVLTLYTTPVVYLYLDRFQQWLNGKTGTRRLDEHELQIAAE